MSTVLKSPVNGQTVDLCARYQHEFDECKKFRETKKLILSLDKKTENPWDNTTPAPVSFVWETDEAQSILEISEDSSFESSDRYTVSGNTFSVCNLKKSTEYFWRVNESEAQSFVTDSVMPRWIAVDGIGNVRDYGGWQNTDGKRIKQGLIFRGYKLENSVTGTGIEQLKKLGIKTELDLRRESVDVVDRSCIDESVKYVNIACNGYEEFAQTEVDNGVCRRLIEFMADSGNYPIYFHCAGGQDRTGTLAFLMDAILGLDDETMLKEYELTMLSSPYQKISRSRKGKFKPFLKHLNKNGSRKASIRENTLTFLRNAGVTEETMKQLCDNLLEKA